MVGSPACCGAEVLEHLRSDVGALDHLVPLLRPGGAIVLTVPFFHDVAEVHVRIYSPRTIHRTLAMAGLRAVTVVYRPGPFPAWSRPLVNRALHLVNALAWCATGRTVYGTILPWLWRLSDRLGRHPFPSRWSSMFGATIVAVPAARKDYAARNREHFFG